SKKFAVIIAAHNEERVVEGVIRSIQKQDYPEDLYRIMVICDNCTDNTVQVVKENGVLAFERKNDGARGKGYALQWMFERLFKMDEKFDAVVVLDADNVISHNYLLSMNDMLCKGHKVIQGYLDSKNPDDSWVSISYAIAYWFMGRMWQLARYRLGLPNALGGTGMCFEISTLKDLGWNATSLTEDLEFTMKSVLHGIRPVWAHYAKVYDEKPIGFQASWNQRLRWMQGHWDVAFRYIKPLFKRMVLKGDVAALDCILYLLQPSRILLSYFTLVVNIVLALTPYVYVFNWLHSGVFFPKYVWIALFVIQWILPPSVAFIMILERVKLRRLLGLVWYQFFGLSWLPLSVIGLFTHKNKEWTHTVHSQKIDIDTIENNTGKIKPAIAKTAVVTHISGG
ncbi:MAG TPA: glycosyltransferase family 2 protein, partial [Desulfobacteria bacterium]|nr:glycosyltransferase family 2 protein [Desulfobacteria bacterium]